MVGSDGDDEFYERNGVHSPAKYIGISKKAHNSFYNTMYHLWSRLHWSWSKPKLKRQLLVVVVVILFPTEYKQWKAEYMSNIITTMKP